MSPLRSVLLTLVLATLAAAVGAWGGAQYVLARAERKPALEQVVRRELDLTSAQQQRIDRLSRDYAARRTALEAEMRAANAELAQVFREDHAYTPRVQAAIDRFHTAMGTLQKASIVHVLAIRENLTPAQAARFDDTVARTLTQDTP